MNSRVTIPWGARSSGVGAFLRRGESVGVRVLLPLFRGTERLRWDEAGIGPIDGGIEWSLLAEFAQGPEWDFLQPAAGQIHPPTSAAILAVLGQHTPLTAATWEGYADASGALSVRARGERWEISPTSLAGALSPRHQRHYPNFLWDEDSGFALGSEIAGDSLYLSVSPEQAQALLQDPRLEVHEVRVRSLAR